MWKDQDVYLIISCCAKIEQICKTNCHLISFIQTWCNDDACLSELYYFYRFFLLLSNFLVLKYIYNIYNSIIMLKVQTRSQQTIMFPKLIFKTVACMVN